MNNLKNTKEVETLIIHFEELLLLARIQIEDGFIYLEKNEYQIAFSKFYSALCDLIGVFIYIHYYYKNNDYPPNDYIKTDLKEIYESALKIFKAEVPLTKMQFEYLKDNNDIMELINNLKDYKNINIETLNKDNIKNMLINIISSFVKQYTYNDLGNIGKASIIKSFDPYLYIYEIIE